MLELRVILNCKSEYIAQDNYYRVHYVPSVVHFKKLQSSTLDLLELGERTFLVSNLHDLCESIFLVPYHLIEIITDDNRKVGVVSITYWGEKDITRRLEYIKLIKDDQGEVIKREVLQFDKSQVQYLTEYGKYVMFHFNLDSLYKWSSFRLIPTDENLSQFLFYKYESEEYDTYDLHEAIDVLTTIDSVGIIFTNKGIAGYMLDITNKPAFILKKLYHTVINAMPADIIATAKRKRKPTKGTHIDYETPGHGDIISMEAEGGELISRFERQPDASTIYQKLDEPKYIPEFGWLGPRKELEERKLSGGFKHLPEGSPERRKLMADILRNRRNLKWIPGEKATTDRKKKE